MRRRKGLKAQMRDWNHASREIAAAARNAREGKPSSIAALGRTFQTRLFHSVDDANAFMERNDLWGVIRATGNDIHVAHKHDEGTPIAKART